MKLLFLLLGQMPVDGEPLEAIRNSTFRTAENTTFGVWDGLALAFSFLALYYTWKTYRSQKETESNTQRTQDNTKRITLESQKHLLYDLIRHLYRNMVITYTMKVKMDRAMVDAGADAYVAYPSEEHLIKLKIPMENIHLNVFYGNDKQYMAMNDLYLKMRNYNEEINVACQHFKDPAIDMETKRRDFGTLLLKPGFLTERIVDTVKKVWGEDCSQRAREIIQDAHNGSSNARKGRPDERFATFVRYANENDDYVRTFFGSDAEVFFNWLEEDVREECGYNSSDTEKVHLIAFK